MLKVDYSYDQINTLKNSYNFLSYLNFNTFIWAELAFKLNKNIFEKKDVLVPKLLIILTKKSKFNLPFQILKFKSKATNNKLSNSYYI